MLLSRACSTHSGTINASVKYILSFWKQALWIPGCSQIKPFRNAHSIYSHMDLSHHSVQPEFYSKSDYKVHLQFYQPKPPQNTGCSVYSVILPLALMQRLSHELYFNEVEKTISVSTVAPPLQVSPPLNRNEVLIFSLSPQWFLRK